MDVKEWDKDGLKPSYFVEPCPYCSAYPKMWHLPGVGWSFSHCCEDSRPPKINIYIERRQQEDAARDWNDYVVLRISGDAQLTLF